MLLEIQIFIIQIIDFKEMQFKSNRWKNRMLK